VGFVEIPKAGLYTLYAFATPGAGLSFLADGCASSILCPAPGARLAWRPVLTRRFEAGRHHLDLMLGAGARVEGLRLELKRDAPEDYAVALRSLGFDPGPPGPVEAARASEAERFVKNRRAERTVQGCGDLPLPPPSPLSAPALTAGAPTGPQPPGNTGATPDVPPFPLVDPQAPASPVRPVGS